MVIIHGKGPLPPAFHCKDLINQGDFFCVANFLSSPRLHKVSLTFDCSDLCSLNPYPRHLQCTKDADVEGRMRKTLQAMERTRMRL